MAAHVFPLTVKLLLEREGHSTLTDDDRIRCLAVDKILASPRWFEDEDRDDGSESQVSASRIMSKIRLNSMFEKAAAQFYAAEPKPAGEGQGTG